MSKAIKDYEKFNQNCPELMKISFNCPHCDAMLNALKPPVGTVWDSTSMCPFCEGMFLKIVKHNEVEILTFNKME